MKMSKDDPIKARRACQELLGQTLKELCFSVLCLAAVSVLSRMIFVPYADRMIDLITLLLGLAFGVVIGAARAYIIFWEKTDFEDGVKNENG